MNELLMCSAVKGQPHVDKEVLNRARELMKEDRRLAFSAAFRTLLASDRDLARRYRTAHERELPEGPV